MEEWPIMAIYLRVEKIEGRYLIPFDEPIPWEFEIPDAKKRMLAERPELLESMIKAVRGLIRS